MLSYSKALHSFSPWEKGFMQVLHLLCITIAIAIYRSNGALPKQQQEQGAAMRVQWSKGFSSAKAGCCAEEAPSGAKGEQLASMHFFPERLPCCLQWCICSLLEAPCAVIGVFKMVYLFAEEQRRSFPFCPERFSSLLIQYQRDASQSATLL